LIKFQGAIRVFVTKEILNGAGGERTKEEKLEAIQKDRTAKQWAADEITPGDMR